MYIDPCRKCDFPPNLPQIKTHRSMYKFLSHVICHLYIDLRTWNRQTYDRNYKINFQLKFLALYQVSIPCPSCKSSFQWPEYLAPFICTYVPTPFALSSLH